MTLKYVAAYLMSALAGNESPSAADIQKILESVESDYDESIASKLVSEMEGKTIHEVIASGKEKLKGFGGGGGGGGVAVAAGGGGGGGAAPAAEKKEEKKVEEEEEEEDMEFDLFG
uniref:60S acidic ribosomal protein P2 n=1 Tax=Alexandrium andersonii TaxID=327968 RepID=A0A7S2J5S1_9DINO|mmetsp:Transcript_9464/g.21509  ORF Transcript_9464/g.21509 Transcript_9464/m.21509 type:complete len:116 (+) Transcript_9464:84-431(+)